MPAPLSLELLATFSKREQKEWLAYLVGQEPRLRADVFNWAKLVTRQTAKGSTQLFAELQQFMSVVNVSEHQLNNWLYTELQQFLLARLSRKQTPVALVEEFHQRGLHQHRDRLLRKLRKHAQKGPTDYSLNYALELAEDKTTLRENRGKSTNFQVLSDQLDLSFVKEKLRRACSLRSHENVSKVAYDYGLLDAVLTFTANLPLEHHPLIAAYYHAYSFMTRPEEQLHYSAFQQILDQHAERFSADELREVYYLAINYFIRRINQNDQAAGTAALALYKEGLQSGIFLEGGQLSAQTYRNVVTLATSIKDYDWAEQCIETYNHLLPKGQQTDQLHYNRARLAHARGDADQALEELRFVQPKDVLFLLSSDVFRAKIYYEIGEKDLLETHLDKMAIFIKRNKHSYHARNYQTFVRLCQKLVRANAGDTKKTQDLIAEINATDVLTEKRWLLRQVSKYQ